LSLPCLFNARLHLPGDALSKCRQKEVETGPYGSPGACGRQSALECFLLWVVYLLLDDVLGDLLPEFGASFEGTRSQCHAQPLAYGLLGEFIGSAQERAKSADEAFGGNYVGQPGRASHHGRKLLLLRTHGHAGLSIRGGFADLLGGTGGDSHAKTGGSGSSGPEASRPSIHSWPDQGAKITDEFADITASGLSLESLRQYVR
jgi:hypothetical protein